MVSRKKTEITLTKELEKTIDSFSSRTKIFSNRCPSKSSIIRNKWKAKFMETCPPLQPEIDLIMWEPPEYNKSENDWTLRAIEIKYFKKINGSINQSFYKGIEQTLALLQWGFDNVALWQLFDKSISEDEMLSYGGRTWAYIHNRIPLPIEYTMIEIVENELSNKKFRVIQPDWENFPEIKWKKWLVELYPFGWKRENPLRNYTNKDYKHPLLKKFIEESQFLRNMLIDWLNLNKD
jgi:hypothetical protein